MNLDTIAIESQATITTNTDAGNSADQACEIMPISSECFELVGGGMGIMLLG